MPIHELGYRGWEGRPTPRAFRWVVIAGTGIRLAWKQPWLRRLCFLAWLPSLYFGAFFFAYEKFVEYASERALVSGSARAVSPGWVRGFVPEGLPFPRELGRAIMADPARARAPTWRYVFYMFFRAPQAVLFALVVGLVGPPLLARDFQSRAFILYFSRPLTPVEYLIGKAAVVLVFGLAVTALPAFLLYAIAVLLSPSISVLADTGDVPFRIFGASAILMVPTTALTLALSSIVTETRYASFGWFALWVLGAILYRIREDAILLVYGPAGAEGAASGGGWLCLSLFDALGKAQEWAFGAAAAGRDARIALAFLALTAAVSSAVLLRRVSAPLRT
ncbi:MAG: ABC transporter permease subunit [Planctomycetota bacterium]